MTFSVPKSFNMATASTKGVKRAISFLGLAGYIVAIRTVLI